MKTIYLLVNADNVPQEEPNFELFTGIEDLNSVYGWEYKTLEEAHIAEFEILFTEEEVQDYYNF